MSIPELSLTQTINEAVTRLAGIADDISSTERVIEAISAAIRKESALNYSLSPDELMSSVSHAFDEHLLNRVPYRDCELLCKTGRLGLMEYAEEIYDDCV